MHIKKFFNLIEFEEQQRIRKEKADAKRDLMQSKGFKAEEIDGNEESEIDMVNENSD